MNLTEFRQKPVYPVVYMFVVMFCFTAVLVGLARSASGRIQANKQVFFERALLVAVGAQCDELSPAAIHTKFMETVRQPTTESFGAYVYVGNGQVPIAYALPFEGQGFWSVIKGVIGIKPDGRTLTGIAFHEQSETPGLGAEIVKPRFCAQFKGFVLAVGPVPLRFAAGGSGGGSDIDAITGATQTCTRLEKILNNALMQWRDSR